MTTKLAIKDNAAVSEQRRSKRRRIDNKEKKHHEKHGIDGEESQGSLDISTCSKHEVETYKPTKSFVVENRSIATSNGKITETDGNDSKHSVHQLPANSKLMGKSKTSTEKDIHSAQSTIYASSSENVERAHKDAMSRQLIVQRARLFLLKKLSNNVPKYFYDNNS